MICKSLFGYNPLYPNSGITLVWPPGGSNLPQNTKYSSKTQKLSYIVNQHIYKNGSMTFFDHFDMPDFLVTFSRSLNLTLTLKTEKTSFFSFFVIFSALFAREHPTFYFSTNSSIYCRFLKTIFKVIWWFWVVHPMCESGPNWQKSHKTQTKLETVIFREKLKWPFLNISTRRIFW